MGYEPGRVLDVSRCALYERDDTIANEMVSDETHGIAQWSSNRLLVDSTGLGWHDAYTSLAVESSWSATLPALPHVGLAYCTRQAARIRRKVDGARREQADLLPRRFGLIPADRASTWDLDGNPEVQLVYLRRSTLDELIVDAFETDPKSVWIEPQLGFNDAVLEPLVVSLLEAARTGTRSTASALWADHVIRAIGIELLRRHSNLTRPPTTASDLSRSRLDAARDYIESNLADDLSLTGIADAVGMRPHRLARDFRAGAGLPLHQYVIARRVERASHLLRATTLPIAVIAAECGFADQAHLTNTFRRRVGVTPALYRTS